MNRLEQPTDEGTDHEEVSPLAGTPRRWFVRGMGVGMLLMASVNALSYFFRSKSWRGLVGQVPRDSGESLGFPFQVWEAGNTYGGMYADYPMIGLNILVAALVGMVVGVFVARKTDFLNRLLNESDEDIEGNPDQPVQFSLSGLMIATTLSAIFASVASKLAVRPETLIAIYALGPTALVIIAMLPRNISWQQRVAIITPATFCLIAVAIAVGHGLKMEFDKVLMGIFLCWTPQSALAATVLTISIFVHQEHHSRQSSSTCS